MWSYRRLVWPVMRVTPVLSDLKLRLMFTCATCSSSSGLPFTLCCISLISCRYSFLRWSSCFLRRKTELWIVTTVRLTSSPCCFCEVPEFLEFGLVRLWESQVGVVGLGAFHHNPLQLLLPLLLPFLPQLLLLLGLLPLLQHLSTQGDNPVTDAGRFRWGRVVLEGGGLIVEDMGATIGYEV